MCEWRVLGVAPRGPSQSEELASNSHFSPKRSVAAFRESAAFSNFGLKFGALPKRRYGNLADASHVENCWDQARSDSRARV